MTLGLLESVGMGMTILAIIPIIILFKQYRKTGMMDFLYFSIFFFSGAIAIISDLLIPTYNVLILFQLEWWAFNSCAMILLIHSANLLWEKIPNWIWYGGWSYFVGLSVMILFWDLSPTTPKATVLFFDMPHSFLTHYPQGAGLMLDNGVVIYAAGFRLLGDLFFFFSVGVAIYAYFRIELVVDDPNLKRARLIWLYSLIGLFLWVVSILPWFEVGLVSVIIILVVLPVFGYIGFVIPEFMLISQAQLLRAHDLYFRVIKLETELELEQFGMKRLVQYVRNLPEDVVAQLTLDKIPNN